MPCASPTAPGLKAGCSCCDLRLSSSACCSPLSSFQLGEPVPGQERVAIAAWKLATPGCCRSAASPFGVGKSTVGPVVMEVWDAVVYPASRL